MTKPMTLNMAEITRLMQSGDLAQATQLIQTGLGGSGLPASALPDMPAARGNAPGHAPGVGQGLAPGLAEALAGMRGAGIAGRAGRAAPAPDLPEGASWTTRQHQAAGQARDFRLYVPAALDCAAPAGLVLLLHGCTQDPDDFARGTQILAAAEAHRLIVIAPAQTAQANMNRCWNWFEPRHAAQEGGEAAFLADLTRSIAHEFEIPPERRFAAGLSAGGAMAVILGAEFAGDFGAVACHSGLPNGAARDMGGAFAAMSQGGSAAGTGVGCRLLVLHGTKDATVSPRNADAVVQQALHRQPGLVLRAADARLEGRQVRIRRHRDAEGHLRIEDWRIEGLAHAWSGGAASGSHTAPGPSATEAMIAFFLSDAR